MKAIKTIVVPTDLSQLSETALEYASALAAQGNARLLIVHVEEPPITAAGMGHFEYGLPDTDQDALREMLGKVRPTDPKVRYQHVWLKGEPAAQITSFAKQEQADLIVLSSHGRTGLLRLIMGSVAEAVMRNAESPVLVVKPQTAAAAVQTAGSAP